eukprot:9956785-Alexandrium_andersonii.AAC.1
MKEEEKEEDSLLGESPGVATVDDGQARTEVVMAPSAADGLGCYLDTEGLGSEIPGLQVLDASIAHEAAHRAPPQQLARTVRGGMRAVSRLSRRVSSRSWQPCWPA